MNLVRAVLCATALTLVVAAAPELFPNTGIAVAGDSRKAKKAFKAGKKAYAKGEFASAAELFKQAYDYDPKPEILYNIGQSLKDAGEFQEALSFFTRYLEELPNAPNAEAVQETLFELQQLIAGTLATLTIAGPSDGLNVYIDDDGEPRCTTPCIITVSPGSHTVALDFEGELMSRSVEPQAGEAVAVEFTEPGGKVGTVFVTSSMPGTVFIDGEDRGKAPLGPVELEPGIYPVAIVIDGKTRWSKNVEVIPGQETAVQAKIEPLEEAVSSGGGAGFMTVTGVSLIGIGVGSFAAGGFFGLSASSIESDLQDQASRGEQPNAELIAQGESQALYANLFYGVGAVAVAGGLILYLLDDTGSAESAPSTGITPTEGGALVHTRFEF
jgi:hypothetical protein